MVISQKNINIHQDKTVHSKSSECLPASRAQQSGVETRNEVESHEGKSVFNRFLHFGPLRGPPVEMTKAQILITIGIITKLGDIVRPPRYKDSGSSRRQAVKNDIKSPRSALRRELRVRAGAQQELQALNSQPFQNRIHNKLCITVFCVFAASLQNLCRYRPTKSHQERG